MPARPVKKTIVAGFALIGFVSVLLLCIGLVMDFRSIDQTQGGYEPPYTDFTGQPIRWQELDSTATGMVHRGYVVDVLIDCSSGMMTFDVFGLAIPWRHFSERALVVHKPRDACEERGFSPRF
ncbi:MULTISPECIES: hypothetical protein [unclassified Halomonas]|uniref:hypothetical protein n=1 Tax=unclassified Halomonas TaxID=2609666 RepID=UPI0009903843|nr:MULTISPECIES: hypothetical protein [unclassified Halomonas]AQU83165.1 hypothetical protein B2G49_11695 [Halomonas sp. 'Soap Lake \